MQWGYNSMSLYEFYKLVEKTQKELSEQYDKENECPEYVKERKEDYE